MEIQPFTNVCETDSAVILVSGKASGQHVKRSIQVNTYLYPFEGGKGPTISICMLSNLVSGVLKVSGGVIVCLWTFDFWHCKQVLIHWQTSALIPGQTKRVVTRCCLPLMLGCDTECRESNTLRRNYSGTYGQGTPVDVPHNIVPSDEGNGTALSLSEDVVVWNLIRSGSVSWGAAISFKSTEQLECKVIVSIRESASATALFDPLVYLISVVNCSM